MRNFIIPIKYKFLAVLMMITLSALGVFFHYTNQIFSEDKKLFVMDLNLTLLRAATSEIKLELRTRLEELQILIPRIYSAPPTETKKFNPYEGLSASLPEELLRIRFYKREGTKIESVKEYKNTALIEKKSLDVNDLKEIDTKQELKLTSYFDSPGLELKNRSVEILKGNKKTDLAILTVILPGNFVDSESKEVVIVVDMIQDFLRRKLNQSEVAQLFLINKSGVLLSHAALGPTVQFATRPFPHPITGRLKTKVLPRESFELDIDGEPHLCNISETGFPDVFAVSQIRKKEAFNALKVLMEKSLLLAGLILCAAVVVSILFASSLTSNITKLRYAAEQIGQGVLKVKMKVNSNDEVGSVARSFEWMSGRLEKLMEESVHKARMEEELVTARVIQSTLLTPPTIESTNVAIESHYLAATECGGDVWDARLDGNRLTIFIADATGHGAPAAIVTAVAKGCFSTLSSIYEGQPLTPDQYLHILNQIIYSSCRGQLLMTMCIVQIDLETGETLIANAGHESPMCMRSHKITGIAKSTDKEHKSSVDVFFARGERLGFDPGSAYTCSRYEMREGDTLFLYTDGISEARNSKGKELGERMLRKSLTQKAGGSLQEMKRSLVDAVNLHTDGVTQEDDITFVLVSIEALTGRKREDEAA